jgi:hypothetical protein
MGKDWPLRKTKNDREAGFSSATKEKTPHNRRHVPVQFAHRLFEAN